MNVLVTGANSFLGTHVIKMLLGRKIAVRAMMRPGAVHHLPPEQHLSIFRGCLTSVDDLQEAVNGCTHVIHLAADTSQGHRRHEDYLPVNVRATLNLFNASSEAHCSRFVFVSSANTIGYGTLEQPGDEGKEPSPLFRRSGYASSKMIAEQLLLEAAAGTSTGLVIVNPTFLLGPEDHNPHSGRIFKLILNRHICFYPRGGKNFIDVRDAAGSVIMALSEGKCGERYLLGGTNLSYRDFFHSVASHNRRWPLFVVLPDTLLLAAGAIGSLLRILGLRTALDLNNARILTIRNYHNNHKSTRDLGLRCRAINFTIEDYLRWKNRTSESPSLQE